MAKVGAHTLSALYNVLAWKQHSKYKGLDVYNEVYFQDPVLNMTIDVKYVMATPLFTSSEVLSFLKKSTPKLIIGKLLKPHGLKLEHAHFIDASDRVWVNYHVMMYLLATAHPERFVTWTDRRIINYKNKLTINAEGNDKFYFWARKPKIDLLNDTMMVQGAFVERSNAISLKKLADHYNKNIVQLVNILKHHGLVAQIDNRATFWNPTLVSNHQGVFGTYQPKDKANNDKTDKPYANVYIDKVKGIPVLNNIIFNKQNKVEL